MKLSLRVFFERVAPARQLLIPQLSTPFKITQDSIRRHPSRFRFDLPCYARVFLNRLCHPGDGLTIPLSKGLLPLGPLNEGPSESEDGQNYPAPGDHFGATVRGTVAFMRP